MPLIKMLKSSCPKIGLVRDLNPGPLTPKARIIPLDQQATLLSCCSVQLYLGAEEWKGILQKKQTSKETDKQTKLKQIYILFFYRIDIFYTGYILFKI